MNTGKSVLQKMSCNVDHIIINQTRNEFCYQLHNEFWSIE